MPSVSERAPYSPSGTLTWIAPCLARKRFRGLYTGIKLDTGCSMTKWISFMTQYLRMYNMRRTKRLASFTLRKYRLPRTLRRDRPVLDLDMNTQVEHGGPIQYVEPEMHACGHRVCMHMHMRGSPCLDEGASPYSKHETNVAHACNSIAWVTAP